MGSYSLKISCWNIQGLRSSIFGVKSQHSDFKREIQNSDIIILQETWNVRDLSTGCPIGFREIILPSPNWEGWHRAETRGGMLIWYRTELIDSIKSIKIGKSYIWLKIQKDIVSTDHHIFLCATYLPPAESPYYNEETFSILQDEICHFQTKGNVLICGDLNARTGNEPDFVNTQETNILQTPALSALISPQKKLWQLHKQKWENPTTALSVTGPVYSERSHTRRLFWLLYL